MSTPCRVSGYQDSIKFAQILKFYHKIVKIFSTFKTHVPYSIMTDHFLLETYLIYLNLTNFHYTCDDCGLSIYNY